MKFFILLFTLSVFSNNLYAKLLDFSCSSDSQFFYINGMNTDLTRASSNNYYFSRLLKDNKISKNESIILFNRHFELDDLVESNYQLRKQDLYGITPFYLGDDYINVLIAMIKPFDVYISNTKKTSIDMSQDIDLMYKRINNSDSKNKILVAHSQGNLFANEMYQNKDMNGISVLHLGTPSKISYGKVINDRCDIINILNSSDFETCFGTRAYNKIGFILSKYFEIKKFEKSLSFDFTGHSFVGSYINGGSHLEVKEELIRLSEQKEKNKKSVSISLIWNDERDVDLQIIEPNKHVYHWDMVGEYGNLNKDEKKSGRETYRIKCDSLKDGLEIKIATNATLFNSKSLSDLFNPVKLSLELAGKVENISITPGWNISFKNEPFITVKFKKLKEDGSWEAEIKNGSKLKIINIFNKD